LRTPSLSKIKKTPNPGNIYRSTHSISFVAAAASMSDAISLSFG